LVAIVGCVLFFFSATESPRAMAPVVRKSSTLKKLADPPPAIVPLPEVKPEPTQPKETSGEKKPAIDTAWDKDDDGEVDEGFTGTVFEYWDEEKTVLKSKFPYVNGKDSGLYFKYRKDGTILEQGESLNGKINGTILLYNKNGNVEQEWPYKDNKRHGLLKSYYPSGNIKMERVYQDGNPKKARSYDESGTLQMESIWVKNNESTVIYDKSKGIDLR